MFTKAKVIRVVAETAKETNETFTREQKFEIFVGTCDRLLKQGHITERQHKSWTNIF